ncbi:hypothetical protein EJ06DRAFT_141868 [Trichodelitschia bisporula]|uniref:Uncharacterized protein n=1 Tax=Trichodelitschia bisporula TaxID=703511 RepID=A0A6G1HPM5_9PEZI|nr:hypothetical protein EJ06DRAFT_141868 [Trichodelitschia bisporula]
MLSPPVRPSRYHLQTTSPATHQLASNRGKKPKVWGKAESTSNPAPGHPAHPSAHSKNCKALTQPANCLPSTIRPLRKHPSPHQPTSFPPSSASTLHSCTSCTHSATLCRPLGRVFAAGHAALLVSGLPLSLCHHSTPVTSPHGSHPHSHSHSHGVSSPHASSFTYPVLAAPSAPSQPKARTLPCTTDAVSSGPVRCADRLSASPARQTQTRFPVLSIDS